MAAELVHAATSEKLKDMDWGKNIKICELVAQDPRRAKDVIKQIKKRLGSKNTTRQLFSVMLLEMLMNNIGEDIHRQVIGVGLLPLLVKIVKKKSDLPLRERIFLLLDATQTSLGGASGKFPQYYAAYNDLVSAGVQFSPGPETITSIHSTSKADDGSSSGGSLKSNDLNSAPEETSQIVNESSIIEKACNTLEVLKEVIDAADAQNYGAAKDEFTLDLVEQCSFQKQRVMQLVLTSKDEKLVSRAIELNEDFQKVLARHDALLSVRPTLNANDCNHEETEEEEVEQLFRRIRKGKACAVPENEAHPTKQPSRLADDGLHRPPTRPLCIDPLHDSNAHSSGVVIPPPPLKHVERARFFQENKVDGMKALPLHSRNTSSSHSGSLDSSEWHETG